MNAGSVKSVMNTVLLAMLVVVCLTVQVAPTVAQTPGEVCAADSLYLISPDMLDLRLETTGKPGLTISWPNLDLSQATCFSLADTDGLNFGVVVDGGFGDRVDRILRFSTQNTGVIGGANAGNLTVSWRHEGSANNGSLSGLFNLSNNGGFWSYSEGTAAWSQVNNGLPMTWPRTNVVALDHGTGDFMVAAFTSGVSLDSEAVGLFSYNGTNWARFAVDIFPNGRKITTIKVSPSDNNSFAVGTKNDGLYVTTDGGATFTQWTSELDPASPPISNYEVTALNWESDRLLVALPTWGLFISNNGGVGFSRSIIEVPDNLDSPVQDQELIIPTIKDFSVDVSNSDRIVAALLFHGAYETTDGGTTWHDLYGDLVVPDPGLDPVTGLWVHSGLGVMIDTADPQVIILGVEQKGLYRSADGGVTWNLVAAALQPESSRLTSFAMVNWQGRPGQMLVMEDGWKLLQSSDSGASWNEFAQQPLLNTGVVLVARQDNSGDFVLGSNGGGIYIADTPLPLSETYDAGTSIELRDLDLGLSMTFDGGTMQADDQFRLVAQTFQGWAVWRGASHDPDNMTLIGLFDRVNPEDCFEGFCGDNSLEIVPQCFAAKRAACFNLSNPDTLRFFDEEVFNGFSYFYAVTSFDYGNTALDSPENNKNEMLFSKRWATDELSPFSGTGNRTRINVNAPATAAERDDEIYAFPNPVRIGAGVPRGEGSLVVFTNLPEGARVRVFTTAGDDVINLGPDNQTGAQIYWNTVNRNGESLSAGIYLYKVEMPARDDHWGRIVVIR